MEQRTPSGLSAEAHQAFVSYVARVGRGEAVAFEEICREHAPVADELRRLRDMVETQHERRERVGLTQRIRNQFGAEVDPNISLDRSADVDADPDLAQRVAERLTGKSSSRYRLEGEVARGGQGAIVRVWDQDLRRQLAMKIVLTRTDERTGDTRVDPQAMRRFMEEAQITGQLDHPGIVPVHELGLDDEGQVFFTMKLVKGEDLASVFRKVREGGEGWTRTRALRVMLQVCEAMAYSHDKGVIHRDLKPENVMVGRFGAVYVMDWGLARVVGHEDGRDLRLRSEPVDASVGVSGDSGSALVTMDGDIIGTPAYMPPEQARGDLKAMGPHSDVYAVGAMLYALLTGRAPYVPADSKVNNIDIWKAVMAGPPPPLHTLAEDVPVELEAICERAMARDPGARYPSMSELADDLAAFMENRVVAAYATGAIPEFRKWVQRNRGLAGACAAAAALLVIGLLTSLVLRSRAVRAEGTARAEANRASEASESAEQISEFLVGLFEVVDPGEAKGNTVTAREILDRGVARIDVELADQPMVQSTLMETMGTVYKSLGLYETAAPLLRRALELRQAAFDGEHQLVARSMSRLGDVMRLRADYAAAEPLLRDALSMQKHLFGDDHLEVAETLHELGVVLTESGELGEGEECFRKALEIRRRQLGRDPAVAESLNALAMNLYRRGDEKAPEALLREALEIRRELLGVHPDVAESLNDLAVFLYESRGSEQAKELFREALDLKRELLGDVHSEVALSLNNLAMVLHDEKEYERAEETYRMALEVNRKRLGDVHPNVAQAMNNLAFLLNDKGDLEGARELFLASLATYRRVHGDDHPDVAQQVQRTTIFLSKMLEERGETHPDHADIATDLAEVLLLGGNDEPAQTRAEEALAILWNDPEAEPAAVARAESALGAALTGLGRFEEAEPLLLSSYEALAGIEGGPAPQTRAALARIVRLYEAWSRPAEADEYRRLEAVSPDGEH